MVLEFIGADREVTGSCHYLTFGDTHILIDCGMEQGADLYVNQEIPVNPSLIDYVFVTHAHIDHSGLLPLIYNHGFRGTIFATKATTDLCNIMLKDSAHIQELSFQVISEITTGRSSRIRSMWTVLIMWLWNLHMAIVCTIRRLITRWSLQRSSMRPLQEAAIW